jgi:hypothetical protein
VVQDIRDAQSTEHGLKILSDKIEYALRLRRRVQIDHLQLPATGVGADVGSGTQVAGALVTVASFALPDPGWPYRIAGTAQFLCSNAGAWQGGTRGALMVDTTIMPAGNVAPTSATVVWAYAVSVSTTFGYIRLPYRVCPTVFSGTHTVNLMMQVGAAGGVTSSWGPLNTQPDWVFQLHQIPA